MKLSLLLLFISLQLAASTEAQKVAISRQNATPSALLMDIYQQTGYSFMFDKSWDTKIAPLSVDIKNADLTEALQVIFRNTPFRFQVTDKVIYVEYHPETNTPSPLMTVRGKVVTENGFPVAAASIIIKGSNKGTQTDSAGYFELTNIVPNTILIITAINIEKKEFRVDSKENVVITVQTKITESEEVVVVSTGYQNIKKERMVGSFSKLDSTDFQRRQGVDILSRLDGTVNGVLFNKASGTAPIQIRGISTLGMQSTGSAYSPLIIVDNFPYQGDLNSLNPNDVLDVSVLKDATAASIWGTRAGNGVIVITTKKGRYNQPFNLSITSNITMVDKPDIYYQSTIGSSDFIEIEKFLFDKGYYNSALSNAAGRPIVSPVVEILNNKKLGSISDNDANAQIDALRQYDIRDDYKKYMLRNATRQQYFINLSGGSGNLNYSLSGGYDYNLNNYKGSKGDSRYTLSSVTNFKPIKNLEIEASLNYTYALQKSAILPYPINPGGGKSTLYPYARLADNNGNPLAIPKDRRFNYIDTTGKGKLLDWKYRPIDEIRITNNTAKNQLIRTNFAISYRFTNWLKADIRYQYLAELSDMLNINSLSSYYTRDLINQYTQADGTRIIPLGAIVDQTNSSSTSHNLRAQLNMSKNWSDKHDLTVLLAGEVSKNTSKSNTQRLYGYNEDVASYTSNIDYNSYYSLWGNIADGIDYQIPNVNVFNIGNVNKFVSILGNASYTYNRKYTVYTSARRDGANVFGVNTNNRWKPLWSTGVSWDISREDFYSIKNISYLKIKASFGYMGNVDNSRSGLPTITYIGPASYTNYLSATLNNAPNPDLRWEQVRTTNIGIEFSALQDRLSGSMEWFNKRSSDLIANTPMDPTSGIRNYVVNIASLKGKGFEFELSSKNTVGLIKWGTRFAFSYSKTIITKFYRSSLTASGIMGSVGLNPIEGKDAWGIYSYYWRGLDPANGDPQGFYKKGVSKDYANMLLDSVQNQKFNGSSLPHYFGYLFNSISWKNFTLSANITYRLDYFYKKSTISYNQLFRYWLTNGDYYKRWQKPGDELTTTVPSLIYPASDNRDNFYANSEVNIKRADNIRLQDIRITYFIGDNTRSKKPFKTFQLYLYANNLNVFIWKAEKSNIDPDISATGIPTPKTLTMGININF